jgi:uncharacterized protein
MDAAAPSHSSPFRAGELVVQRRLGIEQRMQEIGTRVIEIGTRVIRQFMPGPHRQLYEQLPMAFVGGRSDTRRGRSPLSRNCRAR